jgi:hypothetical protein
MRSAREPALLALLLAGCGSSSNRPKAEKAQQAQTPAPPPNQPAQRVTVLIRPSRQESNVETDGQHYSVSEKEGDITVSITGSLAQPNRGEANIDAAALKTKPGGTVRGVPVFISENEGIRTATWTEKGTAYAVDIECQAATDIRCSSTKYILDLVASLVDITER